MGAQTLTDLVSEPQFLPPSVPVDRLFRVTLDVYHGMIGQGLLTKRDKVVLLDGFLVEKMTRGAPHVWVTTKLFKRLLGIVGNGWEVRKEDPITLPGAPGGRDSEPEPDLAIVRGVADDFIDHHPGPSDVALVVEVADSSLREDRAGLALYARAGIPAAWLVNLKDRIIEVHTGPTGASSPSGYRDVLVYGEGDEVPVMIDGREVGRIAAREVLP